MFTKSDKCDIIFLLYMTRGDCMIKKEMIAMLLAGGQGSRLGVLTEKVAKPAVAFGGKYRSSTFFYRSDKPSFFNPTSTGMHK